MDLMSREEACTYLHICKTTMSSLVKARQIAYTKIGNKQLFEKADLDDYLLRNRVQVRRNTRLEMAIAGARRRGA